MVEEDEFVPADYVAARVDAFTSLLLNMGTVKDRKLREEGMLMLRAVRMSFKTEPQGQLIEIKSREVGHPL
jgi:hypothetical protein